MQQLKQPYRCSTDPMVEGQLQSMGGRKSKTKQPGSGEDVNAWNKANYELMT